MRTLILVIVLAVVVAFGSEALAQGLGVSGSLEMLPVPGKRVFLPTNPGTNIQKGYFWSYSAKFLCGTIPPTQGLGGPLLPGTYLTAINIRNYNFIEVPIRKTAVETKPENLDQGQLGPFKSVVLGPGQGIEVDCSDVISLLPVPPPHPDLTKEFVKGFVVIVSPLDLDIVGVYTAEPVAP